MAKFHNFFKGNVSLISQGVLNKLKLSRKWSNNGLVLTFQTSKIEEEFSKLFADKLLELSVEAKMEIGHTPDKAYDAFVAKMFSGQTILRDFWSNEYCINMCTQLYECVITACVRQFVITMDSNNLTKTQNGVAHMI